MKTKIAPPTLEKRFVGYGHYELSVKSGESTKTAITGDTDLTTRLNSEYEKEKKEATEEAIAYVNSL